MALKRPISRSAGGGTATVDDTEAAIRRRLWEARRRLRTAAAEGEDPATLKTLQDEVALLTGLTESAARRRRWTVLRVAFFLILAVAGLLQLVRLPEVEVTVEATTRNLTLSSGAASEVVLEGEGVEFLSTDDAEGYRAWCQPNDRTEGEEARDCLPVGELELNGLTFHSGGRFALSQVDDCLDVEVHDGTTTLLWTFRHDQEEYGVGMGTAMLSAGDALRICGKLTEPLSLARPQRLVLGREGATLAARPASPALSDGNVVIASTAQKRTLLPTETVILDQLRDAFVTVRLGEPMVVSLSGIAGTLNSTRGGVVSRDLRPTLFGWVTRSEFVRGLLALLGGALGLLVALSDSLGKLGLDPWRP